MVTIIKPADIIDDLSDHVPESYREHRDSQGIPVYNDLHVDDVAEIETARWDRTGHRGAFINLYGSEGTMDLQIHVLEPGERTKRQHHLFDELVYIAEGSGATQIGTGEEQTVFEWSDHSLFFIPPSTPYRYVNLTDTPATIVSATSLPQWTNLLQRQSLIFDPPFESWTEYYENDLYSQEANVYQGDDIPDEYDNGIPLVWLANFVSDLKSYNELTEWDERGGGGSSCQFPMPDSSMWAHMSEFPVGRYKKAHRHAPGANVIILSGSGYSLLWRENDEELVKFDWEPGSVFTPPGNWFHQHFNTGTEPVRYFALHTPRLGDLHNSTYFDIRNPDNQISYVNEADIIRETFEEHLEEQGIQSRMPDECYEDPDYSFE